MAASVDDQYCFHWPVPLLSRQAFMRFTLVTSTVFKSSPTRLPMLAAFSLLLGFYFGSRVLCFHSLFQASFSVFLCHLFFPIHLAITCTTNNLLKNKFNSVFPSLLLVMISSSSFSAMSRVHCVLFYICWECFSLHLRYFMAASCNSCLISPDVIWTRRPRSKASWTSSFHFCFSSIILHTPGWQGGA